MDEALPILPHLGSEFMLWLWYYSDITGGHIEFDRPEEGELADLDDLASVEIWVDERIAMRHPNQTKVSALLTGENPANTLESRAALVGGKVLHELRLGLRLDDREFYVTLKSAELLIHGAALPTVFVAGNDFTSLICDRMTMLEELDQLLGLLFRKFAKIRVSDEWPETVSNLRSWVYEGDDPNSLPDLEDEADDAELDEARE